MKKLVQDKKCFLFIFIIIGAAHLLLLFYFGTRKEGFHEDEYFTYWSSAGEANLMPDSPYVWRSGYDIQQQFLVKEGSEFSFSAVVENQAQDVHPPLYYLILNVVMSLFQGHFYKWFGILLNSLFSLITYCGIVFFFYRLDTSGRRTILALLAGAVYAMAPSTISNVMLTRMYALSAMWTVLYSDIFLVLMRNPDCRRRKFAAITVSSAVICYFGFLTHYFCLVTPFFFTLGYGVFILFRRKGFLRMLCYGASLLAAIGLAVLSFPASLVHIFQGYRGTDALAGLTSKSPFAMTKQFLPIIDDNVFTGMMIPILSVAGISLLLGFILFLGRRKELSGDSRTGCYCLAVSILSCLGALYFLTRTALFVGDVSCRFFYPVLALFLPLIAYSTVKGLCCGKDFILNTASNRDKSVSDKGKLYLEIGLFGVLTVMTALPYMMGLLQDKVLFLYEDEAEKIAFSTEYSNYPMVMIYNAESAPYRTWYTADQLWPFQNIFYTDYEHIMLDFVEPKLSEAEKVVVYMDCPEDALDKLIGMSPYLSSYMLIRNDPFFHIYLLE